MFFEFKILKYIVPEVSNYENTSYKIIRTSDKNCRFLLLNNKSSVENISQIIRGCFELLDDSMSFYLIVYALDCSKNLACLY
jgi:hypothetical protein